MKNIYLNFRFFFSIKIKFQFQPNKDVTKKIWNKKFSSSNIGHTKWLKINKQPIMLDLL